MFSADILARNAILFRDTVYTVHSTVVHSRTDRPLASLYVTPHLRPINLAPIAQPHTSAQLQRAWWRNSDFAAVVRRCFL